MTNRSDLAVFGHFIRERRRELGLTQTQLGARLGWAQERVSVLERGKYGLPSLPQLCRLAEALALSPGRLFQELGVEGLQGATSGSGASRRRIDLQLATTLDRMHTVEQHLHDAEQQVHRADILRASIREQRKQMASLLDTCREL